MVRRLIQNFLHWLQPQETEVRESEYERQSPSPQPTLPPSQQQPPETNSSQAQHSQVQPDAVPTPPPSNERPSAEPSEQLIQPPAPASAQASNFKMLLSDYRYSPNPAIQDLSHQLSQPSSQPEPQSPASPSSESAPDGSEQALPASENSFSSNTDSLLDISTTKQESSPAEKSTAHTNKRAFHNDFRAADTDIASLDLATDHVSHPKPLTTEPQPAASETGIITKQGVVKLLFKLKQSNHHGYIAPNDGSKDIIFHQKYVGHEIFHQLERGMEVEVTAHVTAGKAYADHVRIL